MKVKEAMRAVLLVPHIVNASVQVLILGAWGGGAFGCDSVKMANLFCRMLDKTQALTLYDEIHFAVPTYPRSNNDQIFQEILTNHFKEKLVFRTDVCQEETDVPPMGESSSSSSQQQGAGRTASSSNSRSRSKEVDSQYPQSHYHDTGQQGMGQTYSQSSHTGP